jgi:hypothetical protein
MKRTILLSSLACLSLLASGCAMCCGTFDDAYPTYGNNWERADRFHGRVGSNLSGAGVIYADQNGVISSDDSVAPGGEVIQPEGEVMRGEVIPGAISHDSH